MSNRLITYNNKIMVPESGKVFSYGTFPPVDFYEIFLSTHNIAKNSDNRISNWTGINNKITFSQSTEVNKPIFVNDSINGYPSLYFTGNQWCIAFYNAGLSNTYFIVWSVDDFDSNNNNIVMDGSYGSRQGIYHRTDNYIYMLGGNTTGVGYPKGAPFNPISSCFMYNGTNSQLWENNNLMAMGNPTPQTTFQIIIGSNYGNSSELKGRICEIIIYERNLSQGEIIATQNYLMTKYAL